MKKTFLLILCAMQAITSFAVVENKKNERQQAYELKKQLKSLQGRIKAYLYLPLGKYSKKNRSLVIKKLLQDTAKAVGAVLIAYGAKKYFSENKSIVDVFSINDIKRIARPNNLNWKNYNGEAIYYSSRFRQGCSIHTPNIKMQSTQTGIFFTHRDIQSPIEFGGGNSAFVATYEIGTVGSNNYIRARVAYPNEDQAKQFIQDMDNQIDALGLWDQYLINRLVMQRNFL